MTADATSRNSSGRLDSFFEISARQSTVAAEVRGGVVTFIAMAYIVVLNPIILRPMRRTSTGTAWTSRRSPPRHRLPQAS